MSKWIDLGKAGDILPGEVRLFEAADLQILVGMLEGGYYAVENLCSHDDAPMGESCLHEGQVACPRHGARFDLRSGRAMRMPAVSPIRTFPVKVEDDRLMVEI